MIRIVQCGLNQTIHARFGEKGACSRGAGREERALRALRDPGLITVASRTLRSGGAAREARAARAAPPRSPSVRLLRAQPPPLPPYPARAKSGRVHRMGESRIVGTIGEAPDEQRQKLEQWEELWREIVVVKARVADLANLCGAAARERDDLQRYVARHVRRLDALVARIPVP